MVDVDEAVENLKLPTLPKRESELMEASLNQPLNAAYSGLASCSHRRAWRVDTQAGQARAGQVPVRRSVQGVIGQLRPEAERDTSKSALAIHFSRWAPSFDDDNDDKSHRYLAPY